MKLYRDGGFAKSDCQFVIVNIVSLCVLSLVMFYRHDGVLFLRNDGFFQLVLEKNQNDWMGLQPLLTIDFLKGMGEILFPTLTQLSPGFVLGRLFGEENIPPIAMTVFSLQLFVATIVLGAVLRVRTSIAVFGAWAACLVTLPYFIPALSYIRIWGNPNFITTIAVAAVALGVFYRIGSRSWSRDIPSVVLITLLYAYTIVVQPVIFVMAAPMIIVMSATLILTAADGRERIRKAVWAVSIALLLAVAFLGYLADLFLFSKTTYFWKELYAPKIDLSDISFFTQRHETAGIFGFFLLAAAPCAAFAALRERGPLRRISLAYLVFFGLLLLTVSYVSLTTGVWRGPPPGYIDMMSLPFQGLFWAVGCGLALGYAQKIRARLAVGSHRFFSGQARSPLTIAAGIAAVPWIALPVSFIQADHINDHGPWPWPMQKTEIVSLMSNEIGLRDGSPFRGRVVNLAGAEGDYDIVFINQHIYDHALIHAMRNDHRQYGFWYFNVPTLMSGNQFTSPFFYLVATRFLKPSGTKSIRAHMAMQLFDARILANLGVRFVIDDKPHPGTGRLRLKSELPSGKTFYVYELEDVNVGNRSPTVARLASDAKNVLKIMADPKFDFSNQLVVNRPLPSGLTPAKWSKIETRRGGLRVSAQSTGKSVLVLPFEFSNCLVASFTSATHTPVKIFRANLNQTGLLFSGRIEGTLVNRFGPLVRGRCRNSDIKDAYRLGLDRMTGWWPQPVSPR